MSDGGPSHASRLALKFLSSWQNQDVAACSRCLHPDVTYVDRIDHADEPTTKETRGVVAATSVLQKIAENWEQLAFRPGTILPSHDGTDTVECKVDFILRHRPTAAPLAGQNRFIFKVQDALISSITVIHEAPVFASFLRMIGSPGARLPELREQDAPPETSAIYGDIKASTGIPQVNLIFRHLATVPGMLEWTWDVLGPVYRSGVIDERIKDLTGNLPAVQSSGIIADLAPDEASDVRDVLAFYHHGNTRNLVALTALVRAGEVPHGEEPDETRFDTMPQPLPPIPPLPRRDDLASDARKIVQELADCHGGARLGVTPSLYLHLALWPDALAAARRVVLGLKSSGQLARESELIIRNAREIADDLVPGLTSGIGGPDRDVRASALLAVEAFVHHSIPDMAIVGRHLAGQR